MKVLICIADFVILLILFDCVTGRGRHVEISRKDRSMIVMYHNDVRRNVTSASNMKRVRWDSELANFAKKWGEHCIYERPYDDKFGENLFYKRYRRRDKLKEVIMDAIGAWVKQKDVRMPGSRGCRRSRTCKYVQLITADTESVGCTVTKCPALRFRNNKSIRNVYYVVCFYKPMKEVTKDHAHQTGRRCSNCPRGYTCQNNLCVPPKESPVINSLPSPANPVTKYDRRREKTKYQAPGVNIIIRGDPNSSGTKRNDRDSLAVQGLPEKRFRNNRYPAPENQVLSRRVKRQAVRRYDPYQEQRRRWLLERRREEERRRRLLELQNQRRRPRPDDRTLAERRRRLELERERRRRERLIRRRERLERERQRRQRIPRPPAEQVRGGFMLDGERTSVLNAHNNLRRIRGLSPLSWDSKLQRWANYVIRCDIEYPGPITDYTNFGKADSRRDLISVVNNWGSEGNDVYQRLSMGCRTPYDRERCNHYTVIMNGSVDRMGCSSMNCGSRRQLTCIYRNSGARPFRRG